MTAIHASMAEGDMALIDHLPYPVFALKPDLSFQQLNYATETFFERSRSLLIKDNLSDFFLEDSPLFALLRRLSTGVSSLAGQDVTLVSPKLGKKNVTIQLSLLPHDAGYLISLQPRDLFDQLRGQAHFKGAAQSASKLTSLLAHEIKNPLAGIKGAAQLIELEADTQTGELAALIVEETDRITHLLNRIEVTSGHRHLNLQPVNIHEVLAHAVQVTAASFGRHMVIDQEFDPSLPDIAADKALLTQAFVNLLKNACEASGETGYLKLVTSYVRHAAMPRTSLGREKAVPIKIDIIDHGAGIAPDLLDVVFEPFISNKADGSGLGLALVASVIADHEGMISVQSQSGFTQFEIHLPLAQERPNA